MVIIKPTSQIIVKTERLYIQTDTEQTIYDNRTLTLDFSSSQRRKTHHDFCSNQSSVNLVSGYQLSYFLAPVSNYINSVTQSCLTL